MDIKNKEHAKPPYKIKPDDTGYAWRCGMCSQYLGRRQGHPDIDAYKEWENYCPRCGHKIDWFRVGIHPGWGKYEYFREINSHKTKKEKEEEWEKSQASHK